MKENPSTERIELLAEKWLLGTITPEEATEYAEWYNQGQDHPIIIPPDFVLSEKEQRDRLLAFIKKGRPLDNSNRWRKVKRIYYRVAAAAVIVLCLSISLYMTVFRKAGTDPAQLALRQSPADSIMPGGDKAVLKLADGRIINLQQSKDGLLAQQGNSKIIKTKQGQLVYHVLDGKQPLSTQNLLSTPRGGEFTITLADGTRVWLNAASSLTYPCIFEGKNRVVTLTGEAYFEVAHDDNHPFIVHCKDQDVTVMGTHFNINAYEDESTVKTTLLEGKVNITTSSSQEAKYLLPGQQSVLRSHHIQVKKVDPAIAVAWQKGNFMFDNENIQTIMREIARWYNVHITYSGEIPEDKFAGTVSKFKNVTDVLQILQLTGKVHFTIKGKTIVVSKRA